MYGKNGVLTKWVQRRDKSPNIDFLLDADPPEERGSVKTVVVIGYAEGSELQAAQKNYTNANVVGIETDERAHNAASKETQDRIKVLPHTVTLLDATGDQIKTGDADRIVMAYVAPYLSDEELENYFQRASYLQKSGDKFSVSTYGKLHAYAEDKQLNVKSASDMMLLAQNHGYTLAKARVNVARDGQSLRNFTTANELIKYDNTVADQNLKAWHTMEFVFKKGDPAY